MSDHKSLGNAALQQRDFSTAITHYTNGISEDPSNHVLYSNRAAAHLSLGQYEQAVTDASKSVELKQDWVKGYIRKAQALYALNRFQEAMQVIQQAFQYDQNNPQLVKLLQTILQKQQQAAQQNPQMQTMMSILQKLQDPQLMDNIKKNPACAHFAEQGDFVSMIRDLQDNPQNLQHHMQDARLLLILKEVCGLPIQLPTQEDQMRRENEEADKRRAERRRKEQEELEKQKKDEEERNKRPEMQEKLKGNQAYLKKDFDAALMHYSKAIELDPKNITFHLNKASVCIETGKYDECIKECEQTLEMAREEHANFEEVAKIYAKMGNCFFRQGDLDKAVEQYKSSLLEHRARPVVLQLKKAEELLEKKRKEEYINPQIAEEHRKKGGEYFKQGKFPEAKKEYDEAIKRDPGNHIHYSNRAAAYQKLGAYPYAIKDIDECIKINPDFSKAYSRKGQCHMIMKEYHKALQAFDDGLKIDPQNADLLNRRQQLMMQINASGSEEDKAERRAAALNDPEIQGILADPQFQHVLNKLGSDPQAAQQLMQDPQVRERVEKLVAAGVLETK
mmetsp:Transcript_3508/g.13414  ORF Transcript_3508/g.13414 Transcript_3508/m.13414 type:complete len:562 (-) Transcript_3508:113-1798(-)